MSDYYGLLGMARDATGAQIDEAYLRAREIVIADTMATQQEVSERLQALELAHAVLIDPERRVEYDLALASPGSDLQPTQPGQQALVPVAPGSLPAAPGVAEIICPHCGASIPLQAAVCPECGRQVSRPCPKCGQQVVLGQAVCPRCGTYLPEYDRQRFAEAAAVAQRVELEREGSHVRVDALEQANSVKERFACLFWVIVGVLVALLLALAVYLFNSYAQRIDG